MFGFTGSLSESHSSSSRSSLFLLSVAPSISPAALTFEADSTVLALTSDSLTLPADSTSEADLTVSAEGTLEADFTVEAGSTVEADMTLVEADSGSPMSFGLQGMLGRGHIKPRR
ncbi:uncharacterized protein C8R40DRAFT_1113209 [Lentinula edodes]|uniref:uncharacterized protein n=1 Tax=Lentinula edodes TaxID=5353 RepID=UPI001E8E0C2C|nr:uncharacterized protein C8R40DRAFT_1113209 [Lentinula edodes]KAH7873344.1 hypothetical protein C8R40DRAFT_1113209 [Lentinula edodes]